MLRRPHPLGVWLRALQIKVDQLLDSRAVQSVLRLSAIAAYSIVLMWAGYFDWDTSTEKLLWTIGSLLWILLLVLYIRELVSSRHRLLHAATHVSIPMLLVAPLFLYWRWLPAVVILVVVAYILELRFHSAGDAFLFSFGLVVFIGVFAALSMVEIESVDPESGLRSPSDALFWAFSNMLRLNTGTNEVPVTFDGKVLATVVGLCAIVAASLFTAQMVSWVVGTKARKVAEDAATDVSGLSEEIRNLREQLAALRSELSAGQSGDKAAAAAADRATGSP